MLYCIVFLMHFSTCNPVAQYCHYKEEAPGFATSVQGMRVKAGQPCFVLSELFSTLLQLQFTWCSCKGEKRSFVPPVIQQGKQRYLGYAKSEAKQLAISRFRNRTDTDSQEKYIRSRTETYKKLSEEAVPDVF